MTDPKNPSGAARLCRRASRFAAALAIGAGLIFGAALPAAGPAAAAGVDPIATGDAQAADPPFTICEKQTYALCAAARCTVFNGLSYCKCEVEQGDSISLTLDFKKGDVCTFNARGKGNGYMVSTFSLPPAVVKPRGNKAVYTCAKGTSTGAYAQCDGGICFQSSRGNTFPGLGNVAQDQIVCSCPAVVANPDTAKTGFQIIGPYPCDNKFFKYCDSPTATTDNASTQYVGAPTGSARFLTRQLYGSVPQLNECKNPG